MEPSVSLCLCFICQTLSALADLTVTLPSHIQPHLCVQNKQEISIIATETAQNSLSSSSLVLHSNLLPDLLILCFLFSTLNPRKKVASTSQQWIYTQGSWCLLNLTFFTRLKRRVKVWTQRWLHNMVEFPMFLL